MSLLLLHAYPWLMLLGSLVALVRMLRTAWLESDEVRLVVTVEGPALHAVEAGRLVFVPVVLPLPAIVSREVEGPREVQ